MHQNIVIAGYYGFGNTGDEAILAAMIQEFQSLNSGLTLVVVSGNPSQTEKFHKVQAVSWSDIEQITNAIQACDLVILGGGGLFQDYWGFDPSTILTSEQIGIPFYTSIALLSAIFNKKLMLYSVGVGPLLSEEGKNYVRTIAEQASTISVRDEESKEILSSLGISPDRIFVTADPTFQLLLYHAEKDKIIKRKGGTLGIALRNWDVGIQPEFWENEVAKAVDDFLDLNPDWNAVFIHFQDQCETLLDDYDISRRVRSLLKNSRRTSLLKKTSSFWEKAQALSECDLVLGMRLHSLILAAKCGVPVVGLCYDPKVKIALTRMDLEAFGIDLYEFSSSSLLSLLEQANRDRGKIVDSIQKACLELAWSARQNNHLVDVLLSRPPFSHSSLSISTHRLLKNVALSIALQLEKKARLAEQLSASLVSLKKREEELNLIIKTTENRFYECLQEKELELQKKNLEIDALNTKIAEDQEKIRVLQAGTNSDRQTIIDLQIGSLLDQEKISDLEIRSASDQEIISSLKSRAAEDRQKIAELEAQSACDRQSIACLEIKSASDQGMISSLETEVTSNRQLIATLEAQSDSYRQRIASLESESAGDRERISALESKSVSDQVTIAHQSGELHSIKASRGWKLLYACWQIRLFFFPHGSFQEKMVRSIFHPLALFHKYLLDLARRDLRKIYHKMSRHSYVFHLFKQIRNKIFCSKLGSLRVPFQAGLVSIVLPVYNGADYLHEALASILNQIYSNFELIVVNDGSQDNTLEILEGYAKKDDRIRIVDQENQKLPRSLNNGFRLARGEFLTWTSHDNRLKPEFLEKMVSCLKRHPCWDMIYANMDIIGDDGKPLLNSSWFSGYQVPSGSEHIYLPTNTSELNIYPNNFIGGAFLYRKRVHCLIGGYNFRQFTREDYDYWMRINSLMKLRHIDTNLPLYDYRFHEKSLTNHDKELKITGDRKYLMVFDDFRRDLYLTPLIWVIDQDHQNPIQNKRMEKIVRSIKNNGHKLFHPDQVETMVLPQQWIPLIYLRITSDPNSNHTIPEKLPPGAIKALLCLTDADLPKSAAENWDIFAVWGNPEMIPGLDNGTHGWWASRDLNPLLNAIDIYARSEHAERVETDIQRENSSDLKISVIICTYKRTQGLENVLRSVARQTMPQGKYEVLVVDNDPETSPLEAIIDKIRADEFAASPESLRLIHCPILGLSHARNAGISKAKSDILLFLDDDAIAADNLLEEYWKAYNQHPDAGVIGGHIKVKRPEKLSIVWKEGWERYWSHFVTGYTEYTAVDKWWEFPWGANWSARRKALYQIGGFRGSYGRTGNDFGGGEEIIAANLIKSLDYSIAILPQAEVIHDVDPSRFTMKHLRQTIRAGHYSHYQAQLELRRPVESNLANTTYEIKRTLVRLFHLVTSLQDPDNKATLIETIYHLSAYLQLFSRRISDDMKRFSI